MDAPVWREGEKHVATLAFGSNLGDRFANIEHALRFLEDGPTIAACGIRLVDAVSSEPQVVIMDTSFLYETAPMYVEDQPLFVNGTCLVSSTCQAVHCLMLP